MELLQFCCDGSRRYENKKLARNGSCGDGFDHGFTLLLVEMHIGMTRLADEETIARAARAAEGFTLAQLSELYASAALQMHYENETDLERLISGMKSDYAKGRSREWMADGQPRKLGFVQDE